MKKWGITNGISTVKVCTVCCTISVSFATAKRLVSITGRFWMSQVMSTVGPSPQKFQSKQVVEMIPSTWNLMMKFKPWLESLFSSSQRPPCPADSELDKDIMAVEMSADTLLVTLVSFTIHKAVSLRFAFSVQYNSNICWNFAFTQIYGLVSSPATSQTVSMT